MSHTHTHNNKTWSVGYKIVNEDPPFLWALTFQLGTRQRIKKVKSVKATVSKMVLSTTVKDRAAREPGGAGVWEGLPEVAASQQV